MRKKELEDRSGFRMGETGKEYGRQKAKRVHASNKMI